MDPVYRPQEFYSQLHTLIVFNLPVLQELQLIKPSTLILAIVQSLKVNSVLGAAGSLQYKNSATGIGPLEVVDLATIQYIIRRVLDHDSWVIVDRSRPFAQASFNVDG